MVRLCLLPAVSTSSAERLPSPSLASILTATLFMLTWLAASPLAGLTEIQSEASAGTSSFQAQLVRKLTVAVYSLKGAFISPGPEKENLSSVSVAFSVQAHTAANTAAASRILNFFILYIYIFLSDSEALTYLEYGGRFDAVEAAERIDRSVIFDRDAAQRIP